MSGKTEISKIYRKRRFTPITGVRYTTLSEIDSCVIKKLTELIMAKSAKTLVVNIEDLIK